MILFRNTGYSKNLEKEKKFLDLLRAQNQQVFPEEDKGKPNGRDLVEIADQYAQD